MTIHKNCNKFRTTIDIFWICTFIALFPKPSYSIHAQRCFVFAEYSSYPSKHVNPNIYGHITWLIWKRFIFSLNINLCARCSKMRG